jgi:hypothetical protein
VNLNDTIGNLTSNWSDRTLVSDNFWSGYTFNSGTGVNTGAAGLPSAGVPWEIQVALANQTGKDLYLNLPINVSTGYITKLADLVAYGSDGVNPNTSPQANPVWKPLNPNLKVYIELSDETWNSAFVEAETRIDGWANQLSQRALYDYLTKNQDDPLYPGGGNNAYNDGAILASYYNVNRNNDSAFLATYNANPSPWQDGGSPIYFNNSASINGYSIGRGWVGLRDVQISNAFKTAFGETNINAVDTASRVRPVFEWQFGGGWDGALDFIDKTFGSHHPVKYYLYGGGGTFYVDNLDYGFSDVSFANPYFSNGLTDWTASGNAGVAVNGSSLGNPNAPPLFSAIAVNNGATESGNTVTITTSAPHNFVVGQSVQVQGVTISGYNGTFTITSVTPTTFTYQDSTTGLANSGDGIVTGTTPSGQTAYLQPGASLSQNVIFSGNYADITLYTVQSVPGVWLQGLTITLTPVNGGPAINGGQPVSVSEGPSAGPGCFAGNQNSFAWARSVAFYTGNSSYTYKVTFSNTLSSGTVCFDGVAVQTVNGLFNETTAQQQNGGNYWNSGFSDGLNITKNTQADVATDLSYGLHHVSYEGGYEFNQNLGFDDSNGYADMGARGYSSNTPNVGAYANLDPRAEQLAINALQGYYTSGGDLPIEYESSGNINSWAVASPTYFTWNTPKLQAVASVEQTQRPATYGLAPGQSAQGNWLTAPDQWQPKLNTVFLVPRGYYEAKVTSNGYNQSATVPSTFEVLVDGSLIGTVTVPTATSYSQPVTVTIPVGLLPAGQHSLELYNNSAPGGPWISIASYTLATVPSPPTPIPTQVDLSSAFNRTGIVSDGSMFSGGLDGDGNALSANLLGTSQTWNETTFNIGAPGSNDVVSAVGQTISVPAGQYASLQFLATAVNGNQANQTFTVTYADGTTATFTQSFSDWYTPQDYSGESIAVAMNYRDRGNGTKDNRTFYVYGYSFELNATKTITSITLPNQNNVKILAINLVS